MKRKLPTLQVRKGWLSKIKEAETFHAFGFDAKKAARSGKLTTAQKAAITRALNRTAPMRRHMKEKGDMVFVPVKSAYRRARSKQTGEVAMSTNKGVFVGVDTKAIEKTGKGKVRVSIEKGGTLSIRYGRRKITTKAASRMKLALRPYDALMEEFKKSGASSMSIVINGYETGVTRSSGIVETNQFETYFDALWRDVERSIRERNERLKAEGKQPVDYTVRDVISYRFYDGDDEEFEGMTESEMRAFQKRLRKKAKKGKQINLGD